MTLQALIWTVPGSYVRFYLNHMTQDGEKTKKKEQKMFLFVCSWRKIKRFDQVSSDGRQKMKGENIFSPQKAERGEGSSFHASTSYRPSAPLEKKKTKNDCTCKFFISHKQTWFDIQCAAPPRWKALSSALSRMQADWLTDWLYTLLGSTLFSKYQTHSPQTGRRLRAGRGRE